jgi:hypothetical protein
MRDEKDQNEETPDNSEANEDSNATSQADDKVSDDDLDKAAGGAILQ